MTLTTLAERKTTEAARRVHAALGVAEALRAYARSNRGRFVLFGSFVTGRMGYDSDLDVLVDFQAADAACAWRFVEQVCGDAGIEADIHDAGTSKRAFVARCVFDGRILE